MKKNKGSIPLESAGFTLTETLVVFAVIAVIAAVVLISFSGVRFKARDARRKTEIAQIGKFLTMACYLPESGAGEYDLSFLAEEIINKNPQAAKFLSQVPFDPKTGSETNSNYIYIVNNDGSRCALYANLENPEETITLTINSPAAGGGTGVLKAETSGWNGTALYFQYSN